ncbi:MAG: tripartite tricarboxylate transporter permease, partial [Atribacterota bacterium]|nr:tripartite tricarboxylate transporter permease [Atribacterota bacterium]
PLVTLGIPGSVTAAVLLGAFMIHGMMPGPMLMITHPSTLYGLFFLMLWTDPLGGLVIGVPFIHAAKLFIAKIKKNFLLPIIIILCFIGSYGIAFSVFDMKIVIFFGVLGYLMKIFNLDLSAFLIAFILGPILEENVRLALIISHNNPGVFIRSPIAIFFYLISLFSLLYSLKKK